MAWAHWTTDDKIVTVGASGIVRVWERRRREQWWGIVDRWEFWLAVVISLVTAYWFRRDVRMLQR
jgi:hypothetical protein